MTPRLAAMAALCREAAIPVLVLACIAASGVTAIDRIGAAPIAANLAPSLTADARFAGKPPLVAPRVDDAIVAAKMVADAPLVAETVVAEPVVAGPVVAEPEAAEHVAETIVVASADSSETPRVETPPDHVADMTVASLETGDVNQGTNPVQAAEACSVTDTCIDRYLWALYQSAPKEDAVKTQEQKKVSVKRKGKLVTVTRTVTKVTDEDFAWKDPQAAQKAGMPLMDYVIGGVDRDFKVKLARMLHAAEDAGLSPGITSAFRDDYRQSIASGLKAANNRSYHGGSLRGGYGHGLAADLVSVKGATRAERLTSTQILWKWIDAHGKEFGIGRPYLNRDPPHVAPIDGQEWVDHRPHAKARA